MFINLAQEEVGEVSQLLKLKKKTNLNPKYCLFVLLLLGLRCVYTLCRCDECQPSMYKSPRVSPLLIPVFLRENLSGGRGLFLLAGKWFEAHVF